MAIASRHWISKTLIHRDDIVSFLFFPLFIGRPLRLVKVPIVTLYWVMSTPMLFPVLFGDHYKLSGRRGGTGVIWGIGRVGHCDTATARVMAGLRRVCGKVGSEIQGRDV